MKLIIDISRSRKQDQDVKNLQEILIKKISFVYLLPVLKNYTSIILKPAGIFFTAGSKTMTELEQYIHSYFGLIQQDELDKLSILFQPESLKKGDYFLKAGKTCNKLSFIRSGLLRIFGTTEDKEITQWISSKGFFMTDLSGLIFENPARRTIQALTDTELYTIHKDDYQNIGKIIPQWHELEKRFIAKCFIMMEDRIFSHLSLTAEERYNLFFEHNKELFNQVPLQYLASMLGMTPETFSRIRKKQVS